MERDKSHFTQPKCERGQVGAKTILCLPILNHINNYLLEKYFFLGASQPTRGLRGVCRSKVVWPVCRPYHKYACIYVSTYAHYFRGTILNLAVSLLSVGLLPKQGNKGSSSIVHSTPVFVSQRVVIVSFFQKAIAYNFLISSKFPHGHKWITKECDVLSVVLNQAHKSHLVDIL